MPRRSWLASALALAAVTLGCAEGDPPVQQNLDLARFQGRWFEIARIPRDYDRDCHDTVAEYELTGPNALRMTHSCRVGSSTGTVSRFQATAEADDPKVPAKLSLELGLYRGDYWVLEVGKDYEYAVIGHPSLTMLWVLSRAPKLDAAVWAHARDLAKREGFNVESIRLTPQSSAER